MKQRSESIQEAARTVYDVCVIGGGASGAGCALDSQLRGFKTILVDAGDFGSGTSTASTKLIHGGLRYLPQTFFVGRDGRIVARSYGIRDRETFEADVKRAMGTAPA